MLEISLGRGNWDRLGRRQSSELITAQEHDVSVPELALKWEINVTLYGFAINLMIWDFEEFSTNQSWKMALSRNPRQSYFLNHKCTQIIARPTAQIFTPKRQIDYIVEAQNRDVVG